MIVNNSRGLGMPDDSQITSVIAANGGGGGSGSGGWGDSGAGFGDFSFGDFYGAEYAAPDIGFNAPGYDAPAFDIGVDPFDMGANFGDAVYSSFDAQVDFDVAAQDYEQNSFSGDVVEIVGGRITPEALPPVRDFDFDLTDPWPEQTGGILPGDDAVIEIIGERIPRETLAPSFPIVSRQIEETQEFAGYGYAEPVTVPDSVATDFLYASPAAIVSIPKTQTMMPAPRAGGSGGSGGGFVPNQEREFRETRAPTPAPTPGPASIYVSSGGRMQIPSDSLPYTGGGATVPRTETPGTKPANWWGLALLLGSVLIER